ncbi:MAG: transcriptional regulator [Gammaproteobacteria bacterium]|nr:transcriptional regulator [Gammaproteobacteria bacterium]
MPDRSDIAIRFAEERSRLGYALAAFARELGVSREALRLNELGQRGIAAETLAEAARLGVDVQYVLTGVQSANREAVEKKLLPQVSLTNSGSANVIQVAQAGSKITMVNTAKHVTTTKAEVKPGIDHISESEAALLMRLVDDVVGLESKLKQSPKSHAAVWKSLNAHCGVTRYRLIASSDAAKAERFLRQWIGRLNSSASAPKKDGDGWRKRQYAYIKINSKDEPDWLKNYIWTKFGIESLSDLADEQLRKTYAAVASRKAARL